MASEPRPLIGFAAGVAAGLIASAALAALAAEASRSVEGPEGEPAVPPPPPPRERNAVRYVAGAVLGGIYGLLAEYRAEARDGFDGAYGIATGALLEAPASAGPEESAPPRLFAAMLLGIRALIAGRN